MSSCGLVSTGGKGGVRDLSRSEEYYLWGGTDRGASERVFFHRGRESEDRGAPRPEPVP